ncbi:hypothetical protein HRR78_000208 [Exophiala dermatitidis]|nr:hypothetical protein HRR75_001115 [Exophiala dermatitidis]KAJ4559688.1 hypothetical protein HRR78_000208 [Exophiala dermatitidis]
MYTCKVLTMWSMAAVLGCRLLVTALPRLDYIHVVDKTILIDSQDFDDDDAFLWFPNGSPAIPEAPGTDVDTDAGSNQHDDTGDHVLDDTGIGAVRGPATVYPHDTFPTSILRDQITSPALLKHQPRNALPEVDEEAIPSSLKTMEASGPPVDAGSLTPSLPCSGLSSCPKGYKTYLLMGMCWCRLPPAEA